MNGVRTLCCFFAVYIFASLGCYGQDMLVKNNGDELKVKVVEISSSEIKYKKWSNQNGPVYSVPVTDVFMIKYPNGEKDLFSSSKSQSSKDNAEQENSSVSVSKSVPNSDNSRIIDDFNSAEVVFKSDSKDKDAISAFGILALSNTSTMSSDDLVINLVQVEDELVLEEENGIVQEFVPKGFAGRYMIELVNNTDMNMYVDKGSSFRIDGEGNYKSYYDVVNQSTVNHNSSSGGSLNLGAVTGAFGIGGVIGNLAGGVSVGGSGGSGVSTSFNDERVIVIPPHAKRVLSKDLYTRVNSEKVVVNQKAEYFDKFPLQLIKGLRQGEMRYGDESIGGMKYIITYTTDSEFKSMKQQEFGVYIKECIGIRMRYNGFGLLKPYYSIKDTDLPDSYKKYSKKHVKSKTDNAIIVVQGLIPKEIREAK